MKRAIAFSWTLVIALAACKGESQEPPPPEPGKKQEEPKIESIEFDKLNAVVPEDYTNEDVVQKVRNEWNGRWVEVEGVVTEVTDDSVFMKEVRFHYPGAKEKGITPGAKVKLQGEVMVGQGMGYIGAYVFLEKPKVLKITPGGP